MKTPARLLPILLAFAASRSQEQVAIPADPPARILADTTLHASGDSTVPSPPVPKEARAASDSASRSSRADSTLASTDAAGRAIDTAKPPIDTVHRGPRVPLVVRSSAPIGSKVTLDGVEASMDSSGHFLASIQTDSLRLSTGSFDLCLAAGGQPLCTPLRPQGFDTLDIAPLKIKIDSVVETHDTIRQIVDTSRYDSSALKATGGPKLIQSAAGKTLVIRGKRRPPRVLGEERVSVQTIKRLPGLAEPDVMRAVQALPGVVASSDFSTKIYVRGSASDENLILFDNAVVYNPAHFGGLFSTFLTDAVGGLDFYKGGFDPRYGNRVSSVLLVSSKVGGSDRDSTRDSTSWTRKEFDKGLRGTESLVAGTPSDSEPKASTQNSFRITTFGGTLATDGRQGDWSWALAGRRTWIGSALTAARDLNLTSIQLGYDFYDWQGSAAWGRNGDTVRASIYQGRDELSFSPFTADWGNLVVPVNVRWKLGDRLTFYGTGSYSGFDQTFDFDPIINLYNAVNTWAGKGELRYDAGAGNLVSLGTEYNTFHVNFTDALLVESTTNASITNAELWAGWLQDKWVIDRHNTVVAGLRGYAYDPTGDVSWDPRFSYTWHPNEDWKVDAGWGHYTQYLTSISFFNLDVLNEFWYADQKPMVPTTQNMASLGVERDNLSPLNLHASVEGYYKDLHDMPLFDPTSTNTKSTTGEDYFASNFALVKGYAAGAELSVGKDDGWWTGNISYSYSQAVLQQLPYTNSQGTYIPGAYWAPWDQRHTFKVTGAVNWIGPKGDDALSARHLNVGNFYRSSFQLTANTGQPYTQYLGYEPNNNPEQDLTQGNNAEGGGGRGGGASLVSGPLDGARKPGYFRLDVTPIDWGRTGRWRFYFTIINLTDHDNLWLLNYNTEKNPPTQLRIYQFPRLPIFLGYEYQF
ncbi:MAG TPA: TonB-dependent receptor plug domain-containing protein [Fibrobacteria bacterium]|nr:TonB-dependent receptor plug domain-containing protein [Fibrobacteria bacterium]